MIVMAAKLLLLMLSNLGYWEYFRKKWEMPACFAPAYTLAAQFAALFLPGLLNFLPEAAFCLYAGGFVLLFRELYRRKQALLRPYAVPGFLFLAVMTAAIGVTVNDQVFTWFDSFTHWAVVVKNMLAADRFPTFAQSAVGFMDYPLGGSTLIYYFCRMTGTGEGVQMLAQGFVMVCLILPLFALAGRRSWLEAVFLLGTANFLLCYNVPVTELLVDTLLPLAAMSSGLLLWSQWEKLGARGQREQILFGFPLLFFVLNVKNSAPFFAAALLVLLYWRTRKEKGGLAALGKLCLLLLAGYFLWNRHCNYVFRNAAGGQHAVSLSYFQMRLGEKSLEDMARILKGVAVYAVTRKELWWLVGWLAGLGGLTCVLLPKRKTQWAVLAGWSGGGYVLYALSLAGMYIFSMGLDGALGLECIDRYMKTIDTAILYGAVAWSVFLLEQTAPGGGRMAAGALLLTALVGMWGSLEGFQTVFQSRSDSSQRQYLESILDEYGVEKGYSYLICAQDGVYHYEAYVYRYCLDTDRVAQIQVAQASQMEIEKDYDYIIILDEDNPVIVQWIAEHYPEQAGRQVIQCFK